MCQESWWQPKARDDFVTPRNMGEEEATSNDEAIIRGEGVAVDDRVLVRGNERIRPGQPIAIME